MLPQLSQKYNSQSGSKLTTQKSMIYESSSALAKQGLTSAKNTYDDYTVNPAMQSEETSPLLRKDAQDRFNFKNAVEQKQ